MHHFSSRLGLVCLTSFALWLPSSALARGHDAGQGHDFRTPYAGHQNGWQNREQGRQQAEHRYRPYPENHRPYGQAHHPMPRYAPPHAPAPRVYPILREKPLPSGRDG